jgi:hypothetical protein
MRSKPLVPSALRTVVPLVFSALACSGNGDAPGAAGEKEASVPSELGDGELMRRVDAATVLSNHFPSKADVESVAFQLPGRDLQEDPPRIASAEVVADPAGGASRLEVTFAERMPARLKLLLDGRINELQDDGQGADRVQGDGVYAAWSPASWAGLLDTRAPRVAAEAVQAPLDRLRSGVFIDPARSSWSRTWTWSTTARARRTRARSS